MHIGQLRFIVHGNYVQERERGMEERDRDGERGRGRDGGERERERRDVVSVWLALRVPKAVGRLQTKMPQNLTPINTFTHIIL